MKKNILFVIIITLVFSYSRPTQYSFKNLRNGNWLGEDLLPHPFQDWEVMDEKVFSSINQKKRKLEFLTFDFSENPKNAVIILNFSIKKMKLLRGINTGIDIGSEEYLKGEEWVGKKGVRIGIISDKLVILDGRKKISESKKSILSLFQNSNKISLRVDFIYKRRTKKYDITLSAIAFSGKNKRTGQKILRGKVCSNRLANKKFFIYNKAPAKSIFYENLIVNGGKIRFLNDKKINPIFSPHYIIQKNKLYLNVVFLPINQKINNIEVTFYNSRGAKLFDKTAYVEKGVPYHLFVVDNWKFRVPIKYTIKLNYQKSNDEKKIYERKGKIVNIFRKKIKILTVGENNFFYQKSHFSRDKLEIKFINDMKKQAPNLIFYSANQVDFRNNGKPPLSTSLRKFFFDYLYRLYFFSSYFQELNANNPSMSILGNKDFGQTFLWGSKFKRNQFSQKEGVFLPPKVISEIFNIRRGNLKFIKKKSVKKDLFTRNPFAQEIIFEKSKISFVIINNSFYRYSPKYFIKKFNLDQQNYDKSLLIENDKKFIFAPSQIQYLEKWKNNIAKIAYKKILITSSPFQDFSSLRKSDFFSQNNRRESSQVDYRYNAWPIKERDFLVNNFENILHFSTDQKISGIFQYKDRDGRKGMKLYLQSSIKPNFYKKTFDKSDELIDGFGNTIEKSFLFASKKKTKIQYSVLTIDKKKIQVNRRQISENKISKKKYTIK